MYETLQNIHAGWAIITLLLLIVAVLNSVAGALSKREFKPTDRKIALLALTTIHIQFLIGMIIYFNSPLGLEALGEMRNADLRLTSLEHPLINLIAVTLITVGWSRHKKLLEGKAKFKSIAVFFGIGLLLILSRVPWDLLSAVSQRFF